MTPVLCAVTDRQRWGVGTAGLIGRVAALARAGVHLVQIREADLDTRALMALAAAAVEAVRGTRTRVLVNDRLDVALAAGAHGVHLRGDSVPGFRARTIVPPGFLIGRSVHGVDEGIAVARAGGLDYLIFGTVFETASKPGCTPAGLGPLARLAAAVPLPVLAIGGVTAERAADLALAGAAGLAAVALFGAPDPAAAVEAVSRLFDRSGSIPDN